MALLAGPVGLVEAGLENQRNPLFSSNLLKPHTASAPVKASDSTTQGPAMRTSGEPAPMGMPLTETAVTSAHHLGSAGPLLQGSREAGEERVRLHRLGL